MADGHDRGRDPLAAALVHRRQLELRREARHARPSRARSRRSTAARSARAAAPAAPATRRIYNYDDRLRYRSPPYFLDPVAAALERDAQQRAGPGDQVSVPPPAAPAAPPPRRAPSRARADRAPRGAARLARGAAERRPDAVRFSPAGLVIEHDRALARPLVLPLATLALATVDAGPAKAGDDAGRLPVLRRVGTTAVIPREEGIEGWLWTSRGGSALPSLAERGRAQRRAPVRQAARRRAGRPGSFAPDWVRGARRPLAARRARSSPGLLLRLADTIGAQRGLPPLRASPGR